VKESEVIEAVEKAIKVKLEKEWIKMEHFKDLGEHKVAIHMGEGLDGKVIVLVEAEEEKAA